MEQLKKESDGSSLNIVESNIEQLKALFPEIVSEGKIDFEKLREALGDAVETQEERYNFSWNGKALAKRIAQTQSTGTLRPCKAESKHWDSTQNLFIEGDNLEVLKLLQKSYHKQVKMIYIDPPYNTGNEFIYPDNFQDNLDTYLQYTHQKDDEGRKFGTNPDTSGRYHTNWLNMMYPRLKLAKNLLRDDGVIFISIDDNEQSNLKKLCDEIFGEENFVSQIIWQRSKKGDAKLIAKVHEYILCYSKSKTTTIDAGLWRRKKEGAAEVLAQYAEFKSQFLGDHDKIRAAMQEWFRGLSEKDPRKAHKHYNWSDDRGLYFADNFAGPDDGRANRPRHDILHPITGMTCKKPSTGWRWDEAKTKWALEQNPPRIHFGLDETTIPNRKSYLEEISVEPYPSVFYRDGRSATLEVESYVGNGVFPFPKNTDVISELIELATNPGDLIIDFFAGSGSAGQAVIALNATNGVPRKFILVQLPEPCDIKSEAYKAGYKTIADIGKERIRRAGEKILNATKDGIENLDIGFKVFKLDSSNIKPWDADFDNLEDTLLNIVDNIKEDRSEEDVLTEILLKYGLDLTVPIEERQVSGKTVYVIGFGALVVCLADAITLEVVEGIGHLKAELAPEVMRVVFKDSGFKDDVVKTNAIQILKQYGIDDVKSL
jgi:adenine-specific DNA-methyltransferase